MQRQQLERKSVWEDTAQTPTYPPLATSLQTSVCVVGAGISGLTTAYYLAKGGTAVVVLDDGRIGGGESRHTTAQLTNILDKGYAETERLRGAEGARLAATSHRAAIDAIEQIVADEQIDCDFQRLDGYLFLAPAEDRSTLEDELAAAQRAGISSVGIVERLPVAGTMLGPALRYPQQGHFHILKYLSGLCRAIERLGGKIYSGTRVSKVEDGDSPRVLTENGLQVSAKAIVLATNAPINDVLGYSAKVFAYRTYVIGVRVPSGSIPPLIAFDTEDPYHYVRIQPAGDHDVLLVGGEDHRTGQPEDDAEPFDALERWTRASFPMAGEVSYRWSGQVLNSLDGLALIGRDIVDKHVFVITGDTGMGMTHGTLGGMILADLINGRSNPWAELYNPARLPVKAAGEVISEGASTVAQIKEFVTGGDVRSEDEIAPDSGAVVGWGLGKAAIYRDAQGVLHRRSAVCTHLGCIIGWNDIEKSWDCPCHGSRYDAYGRLVNGPAASDLGPASER